MKLFVVARSLQSSHRWFQLSSLCYLGDYPAYWPLSVSKKDCISEEGVINLAIYISRALSLESHKRIF